jgi:MarR family transcriptional regulator, organic hydroperoxide resistance regulator
MAKQQKLLEITKKNPSRLADEEYLDLWVTLTRSKDALDKVRQKELKRLGVSPEQSGILSAVKTSQTVPTPSELSRTLYKDRTSICLILKKMESKGLIIKNPDSERKNVLRISLTDKGEAVYKQTIKNTRIYDILANLTESQLRSMDKSLKKIFEQANHGLDS